VTALAALRQQLAEIIAPPVPGGETIATGIAPLDAVLEGGGIPCGRLTDLAGAPGSGTTALTRSIVAGALADKRWVAYIDATRTLAPGDWTALATAAVNRPPAGHDQGVVADVLLRSGAFGLVVLDGTPPLKRSVFVRLSRLARESQAALLVVRRQ
jgi:recombination protein RecA